MLKMIPLNRSEAWTLYNKGESIVIQGVSIKKWSVLEKNQGYDYFNEFKDKKMFLQLTKEDSTFIDKTGDFRVLFFMISIFSGGIALDFVRKHMEMGLGVLDPSRWSLSGALLFLIASVFLIKLTESIQNEKKAWLTIFKKHNLKDWEKNYSDD